MNFRTRPCLSLLMCLLLAGASASSFAQQSAEQGQVRESVRRVERETGGRVLRIESIQRNGQDVYRMKVLIPGGRVRVVQDRPTGRPSQRPLISRPAGAERPNPARVATPDRPARALPRDGAS